MSPCVSFWQISKSVQDKGGTSTSQQPADEQTSAQQVPDDIFSYYEQMDKEEEEEEETQTVSFEIRQVVIWFLLQSVLFDPKRHYYSWPFFKLTSCFSWNECSSIHYFNLFFFLKCCEALISGSLLAIVLLQDDSVLSWFYFKLIAIHKKHEIIWPCTTLNCFLLWSGVGDDWRAAEALHSAGVPPPGRVRLSQRHGQPRHQHRPEAHCCAAALPGKESAQDVWKWTRSLRGHCAALRWDS